MILTEEEEIMACPMKLEYSEKIVDSSNEAAPKPGGMTYSNAGAWQALTYPPLYKVDAMKIDIPWHQNPKKSDYNTICFKQLCPVAEGKG